MQFSASLSTYDTREGKETRSEQNDIRKEKIGPVAFFLPRLGETV